MLVIDTPQNCAAKVECLKAAGVNVVLRYYARARQPELPEKRLTHAEALTLTREGIYLGVVYQYRANTKDVFSKAMGLNDGKYAREYAATIIKQPGDSTIYFGVDFDASEKEIDNNILPHFEGVAAALDAQNGLPHYDIGVYGSWVTCDRLTTAGLAKYAWLAQSKGWGGKEGYRKYANSKKWTLKQGFPQDNVCGLDYDPNETATNHTFGQFFVPLN